MNEIFNGDVLVIAPHCDDAELGCAGTVARIVRAGAVVTVAVATVSDQEFLHRGEVRARERVDELERACARLGVGRTTILARGYEARLHQYDAGTFVAQLDRLMDEVRPSVVFLPLPSSHQDHRTTHDLAVAACRPSPQKNYLRAVLGYEYPSTFWGPGAGYAQHGGLYVDISSTFSQKVAALQEYRTQMRDSGLISLAAVEALAALRGVECGVKYAELFRVLRITIVEE